MCSDPGLEFMIDVDGASLFKRDRTYWTNGYTLRDQSHVPPFLRDVLQEAFICGKALNLLKLCSPKVNFKFDNISLNFIFLWELFFEQQEKCADFEGEKRRIRNSITERNKRSERN